jgi:hypothetical protein
LRRIGVLNGLTAEDSQSQARNAAFLQGLAELGWQVGCNLQIEYRWVGGDPRRASPYAAELQVNNGNRRTPIKRTTRSRSYLRIICSTSEKAWHNLFQCFTVSTGWN